MAREKEGQRVRYVSSSDGEGTGGEAAQEDDQDLVSYGQKRRFFSWRCVFARVRHRRAANEVSADSAAPRSS